MLLHVSNILPLAETMDRQVLAMFTYAKNELSSPVPRKPLAVMQR